MKLFGIQSNIYDDSNNLDYKESINNKTSNYYLKDLNKEPTDCAKNISLNHPSFYIKDGSGWINKNGTNIDNDSFLRTSDTLTNKNNIQQLNPRHILTNPYKINSMSKDLASSQKL